MNGPITRAAQEGKSDKDVKNSNSVVDLGSDPRWVVIVGISILILENRYNLMLRNFNQLEKLEAAKAA